MAPAPNPVVTQVLTITKILRDAADRALDAVTAKVAANPADNAAQLDFKQAVVAHAAVLSDCGQMLTEAMGIVAQDAAQTLGPIADATNRLAAVLNRISQMQKAVDVLADLATTTVDIVSAVATLNLSKVATAAGDIETVVEDTIGNSS